MVAQIDEWRGEELPALHAGRDPAAIIKPQYAIERLYEADARAARPIITTEVGQHQMWAAQHFKFEQPNHWMTSAGSAPWATACRPPWACRSRIRTRW